MQPLLIKMHKALLICENCEFSQVQIRAPSFHCMENCNVLFFLGRETLVAWSQSLTDKDQRMSILQQYCTYTIMASISFNCKWFVKLGKAKTGAELRVFLSIAKASAWSWVHTNKVWLFSIMAYKLAIKSCQSEKTVKFLHILRSWPWLNSFNLWDICRYSSSTHHMP